MLTYIINTRQRKYRSELEESVTLNPFVKLEWSVRLNSIVKYNDYLWSFFGLIKSEFSQPMGSSISPQSNNSQVFLVCMMSACTLFVVFTIT